MNSLTPRQGQGWFLRATGRRGKKENPVTSHPALPRRRAGGSGAFQVWICPGEQPGPSPHQQRLSQLRNAGPLLGTEPRA